jgi:hypothetical protein
VKAAAQAAIWNEREAGDALALTIPERAQDGDEGKNPKSE